MEIHLIVAASENNGIGRDNEMLWHLPADLKYFKNKTYGLPVLMGSKTFKSLKYKTLPGRLNLILTRQTHIPNDEAIIVGSLKDAILVAKENDYKLLMVIGGGEVYKLALPYASKIYLTRVHTEIENADTFFPKLDNKEWSLQLEQSFEADEKNPFAYSFQEWIKK